MSEYENGMCRGCGLVLRSGDHVRTVAGAAYHVACVEAPYAPPTMELLNQMLNNSSLPHLG